MKTVKGYTLIDVLFAMAFIVSVVVMATMAYSHLMTNSLKLTQNKSKVLKHGLMSLQVKKDLWRSDSIKVMPDGFISYTDTISIVYLIEETNLFTRTQLSKKDTLNLNIQSVKEIDNGINIEYTQLGEDFNLIVKTNSDIADEINQNMQQLGIRRF